ncbi:hypothetical protein [Taibaiella chishuiensis]|uniref:ParB-like nuclease family protein n=1 Tax=Taibaiella chishuiensis TaxID=1434707 RepID=A0A2P8D625_9BACT|nr:hypothetical protein [Taibaiella chishuiensis]PSK92673.1 hypothetical protein B0I18_103250 [Taibaiella chishuiensis]
MAIAKPSFEIIPLDRLQLDEANPRLPKSLHGEAEEDILQYMLLDASLIELMLAIGKNDFFPGEQLLVVKSGKDSFKVIEGNRRLSALKLLNNPELANVQKTKVQQAVSESQFRPTQIPCLVFSKEEDIHNYLGYRHITGIKEWKLLEKARYLFELWQTQYNELNLNQASRELAKSIGSRKDYVKRILVGYQLFDKIEDEAFYRIPGLDDTTFYFNYIADSLNKQHIAEYLGVDLKEIDDIEEVEIDEVGLQNWTKWLFEKNVEGRTRLIGDSSSLTALNKVLGHNDAKIAFVEKGISLEAALDMTGEADSTFYSHLSNAINSLENADRIVIKVKVTYSDAIDQIKDIRALASKIGRSLQEKEENEDEL